MQPLNGGHLLEATSEKRSRQEGDEVEEDEEGEVGECTCGEKIHLQQILVGGERSAKIHIGEPLYGGALNSKCTRQKYMGKGKYFAKEVQKRLKRLIGKMKVSRSSPGLSYNHENGSFRLADLGLHEKLNFVENTCALSLRDWRGCCGLTGFRN